MRLRGRIRKARGGQTTSHVDYSSVSLLPETDTPPQQDGTSLEMRTKRQTEALLGLSPMSLLTTTLRNGKTFLNF